MTTDAERAILEQVATGDLSPEEAVARLDAARAGAAGAASHRTGPGTEAGVGRPRPTPDEGREGGGGEAAVREIRVRAMAGVVQVVGDATVAEAVAEGYHTIHRDGDTLVIESELTADDGDRDGGFMVDLGPSLRRFGIGRGVGLRQRRPLRVRVNPHLPLDASVSAGSLSLRGVRAPVRCDVAAGNARLEDVSEPVDCTISAGSLQLRGRLDHGDSRIVCDAGSVKVDLERGSSVEITVATNLGKATVLAAGLDAERSHHGLGGTERRFTVGAGDGRLDVRASLGKVTIGAED